MRKANGTGHIDHSIDQLGPSAGRHRLVQGVKRRLVEPLTLDERAGRVDNRCAFGHDLAISCQAVFRPRQAYPTEAGPSSQGHSLPSKTQSAVPRDFSRYDQPPNEMPNGRPIAFKPVADFLRPEAHRLEDLGVVARGRAEVGMQLAGRAGGLEQDLHHSPAQRLSLGQAVGHEQQPRQVVEAEGDIEVVGSVRRLVDRQRPAAQPLGLGRGGWWYEAPMPGC